MCREKTCAPRRVSTKVLLAAAVTREEVLAEVGGASFHRAAQGQLRRRAGIRRALLRASRRRGDRSRGEQWAAREGRAALVLEAVLR